MVMIITILIILFDSNDNDHGNDNYSDDVNGNFIKD